MPVARHKDRAQPIASVNGSETGGRSWIPDLCLHQPRPARNSILVAEQASMAQQSTTKQAMVIDLLLLLAWVKLPLKEAMNQAGMHC